MKYILFVFLSVMLVGCTTSDRNQKYNALLYEKTNQSELRILESMQIPSVSFIDVSLSRVASSLSSYDIDPTEFSNSAVIQNSKPEYGERLVNICRKKVTLARLYDDICLSTDSVWWVDHDIHLAPKE